MPTANWTAAMAAANPPYVVLAEIQYRKFLKCWTSDGAGAYYATFTGWTHPSTDSHYPGLYVGVASMYENSTALSLAASLANCRSTAGSYFPDLANNRVYVRTSGVVNPDTLARVIVTGTIRVATDDMRFASLPPYDAQIDGQSLPSLRQERPDLLRGVISYPSGDLTLNNADGFWDYLCDVSQATGHLWVNNTVTFLAGTTALAYADFYTVAVMQMAVAPTAGNEVCTFQLRSMGNALDKAYPLRTYTDLYTAIDGDQYATALTGRYVPMFWGTCYDMPAILLDTAVPGERYIFCDKTHCNRPTILAVRAIDRSTGAATTLTDGVDYFPALFAEHQFDVVGYSYSTYDIVVDATNSTYTTCGQIAQNILTGANIPTAQIDTSSFAIADGTVFNTLGMYVAGGGDVSVLQMAGDLLQMITRSTFVSFAQAVDGRWTAYLWDPSFDLSTITTLSDLDLYHCEPVADVNTSRSANVSVRYKRYIYHDSWSVASSTSTAGAAELQKNETETVDTCLVSSADAATHATRLAYLNRQPLVQINVEAGPELFSSVLGTKVDLERTRGFGTLNGSTYRVMEVEAKTLKLASMSVDAVLGNQRGLGERVKVAAPNGTADWSSATATQKRQYIYDLDTTTECVDSSDPATYEQWVAW